MKHNPAERPSWLEMQEHGFFTSKKMDMIKFDLVFDEEPPEGVLFKDNKIFVNTKDPTIYERFHQKAIERFIEENEEELEI